ncbi:MAG: hypothetical protein SO471_17730 [Anaerobutyricum hallii]|uniref:hypothetical protein n=1 Tax=Anaerobutyricum hallii TaxID=39488 RepID=UPI002A823021|nr:hypothetical protein [Anaerobutyricum hallii]MDY4579744.1 hypothetical protein [Anaerobutyricum hallii]
MGAIFKLAFIVVLIVFTFSAVTGVAGFLIDIIRFPQKHKKIKVISSAESSDSEDVQADETAEGLTLDENIEIDL